MSNVLSTTKQQQVLALGRLGWSLRRIEAETGIRRETASKYLKEAGIGIRPPGGWGHAEAKAAKEVTTDSAAKAAKEVTTDSAAKAAKEVTTGSAGYRGPVSLCEPYREFIEQGVRLGRNAMGIWQDLVGEHGFEGQYASVGRFVRKLRALSLSACPVITTAPGQEAQVDYGEGPMVRSPTTGKYRRTRLFVMTLGHSRKSVRLLEWKSSSKTWCELHERAFRRLGGTVAVVVLDNLREGVIRPDTYDPELNPLYRDMLAHYGTCGLPCRVRHPDRKGKVESAIGHTQGTALRGKRFESLEDAQSYLDNWSDRWADTRIHGTTKRQVSAMFAEEKPWLQPLPAEPFRYYEFGARTVHLDGCVEIRSGYYSAPPEFIGQRVPVQWDEHRVRVLHPKTHQLLREHRRASAGRRRISREDIPKKTPQTTLQLLVRCKYVGQSVGALCEEIHRRDGQAGVRRILGVLGLAKKHGYGTVDDACRAALECGVPTYRFVRRFIDRRPSLHDSLRQVDPLIRQLEHYRDLIAQQTEGEPNQ